VGFIELHGDHLANPWENVTCGDVID
jgi:hypothetical protein